MIVLGYSFTPKIWSIIVTAAFVCLFIALGNWQLSRADEKNARQAQFAVWADERRFRLYLDEGRLQQFSKIRLCIAHVVG